MFRGFPLGNRKWTWQKPHSTVDTMWYNISSRHSSRYNLAEEVSFERTLIQFRVKYNPSAIMCQAVSLSILFAVSHGSGDVDQEQQGE
jgi:hypothetical protein